MGFDAGKITGHMDLFTDEFNQKADEVEKTKEDLGKDVTPKIGADDRDFKDTADEVKSEKEELGKKVIVPVELDGRPAIEEAKVTDEAIKHELASPTVTPKVDGVPAILEAEATGAAARAAMMDAFGGAGLSGNQSSMMAKFFEGGGNTSAKMLDFAEQGLGLKPGEAKTLVDGISHSLFGSLPPGASAASLVKAILPSPEAFSRALSDGLYSLTTGEATQIAKAYQIAGGEKGQFGGAGSLGGSGLRDAFTAFDSSGSQAALNGGSFGGMLDVIGRDPTGSVGGGGPWQGATRGASTSSSFGGDAGKMAADEFAKAWRAKAATGIQDAQYAIFKGLEDGSIGSSNPWKTLFSGKSGIADDISAAAKKMGVDVGKDFTDSMSKGVMDAAKAATGGGGFFGGLAQQAVGGAGSLFSSIQGLSPAITGAAMAAPLIPPVLGGIGLAAGGALAGTAIGGVGFLGALLPGLLDLKQGYGVYSAQQAFNAAGGYTGPNAAQNVSTLQQATAGANPGNFAVASSLGNLLNGGNGFLAGLETKVNPEILKFLDALTKVLPVIAPFFQSAVTSLTGFFDSVDRGMSSQGFKDFMKAMTKDVGPIMDEFGKFVSNAGGAIGGFLKLFGGPAAEAVGAWFDRVSGGLDSWLNKASISPGAISAMTGAFNFLGAAGDLVWTAFKKVWDTLSPIGAVMIAVLTPAIQGLTWFLNGIPTNVLTGLALGFLGMIALTNPIGQLTLGIVLLGLALKGLQTIMGENFKPMTAADLGNAFAGELGGKTPAELAALKHAQDLGLSPQQVYSAYTAIAPVKAPTGSFSSPTDGIRGFGTGGAPIPNKPNAALTTAQGGDSYGVFSKQNMQQAITDLKNFGHAIKGALDASDADLRNWRHDISHWFDLATTDVADFVTKSIPHAFSGIGEFFASNFDKATHALDTARHTIAHIFDDITGGISNFVTKSVPNAFAGLGNFFKRDFDNATSAVDNARQGIAAGFDAITTGISNFVTQSVPHAFSGLQAAVVGAFSGAGSWLLGVGAQIINGFITGIDAAIHKVNGLTSGIPLIGSSLHIPDIPQFADGGPVGGPIGAPQLAVVHGGEYVLSRAMLAQGTGGGQSIVIHVDARGSSDPAAITAAAKSGITATLPELRRAFIGSRAA